MMFILSRFYNENVFLIASQVNMAKYNFGYILVEDHGRVKLIATLCYFFH